MRCVRRLNAGVLTLAVMVGLCSAVPAEAACYHTTVPSAADYPLASYETCRKAKTNGPTDPGNYFDPYVTVPNDYAILYFDAKNPACAAAARTKLEEKLRSNLAYADAGGKVCDPRRDAAGQPPGTNAFRVHLAGGYVAAIHAAALAFRDAGYPVDDTLLLGVQNHHWPIPSPQDPSCGVQSLAMSTGCPTGGCVNSCMDDYSLTAAGFGWMAAYEKRMGRTTSAGNWASTARSEINKALSHWNQYGSVCYYLKGTTPARCDATRADVDANRANVVGADHNQENPGYGFGLMTSVATACEGLKRAGSPCSFTTEQVWTARQLLIHAQQRTYYDTNARDYRFTAWCRDFRNGNSVGCWDPLFGPDHLPGYLPTLFPLKRFYDATGLKPDPLSVVVHNGWGLGPAYQFDEYREPRFRWARDEFWGPLRKLFYEELAYLTWPAHSPQAFTYWIQPAELAGFGGPGSLTVAGGSTESGSWYPVKMYWRNITTGSGWNLVAHQPFPDPNGNPKDTWYNSVPAPTYPYDHYEVAVSHSGGPWHYCTYKGGYSMWWCTQSNATPAWP